MIKLSFDAKVCQKLNKTKRSNPELFRLIQLKLNFFTKDPNHVSLRRHKLVGDMGDYWSISINRSIRMIYVLVNDEFYFVDIGTHDQVYRKK